MEPEIYNASLHIRFATTSCALTIHSRNPLLSTCLPITWNVSISQTPSLNGHILESSIPTTLRSTPSLQHGLRVLVSSVPEHRNASMPANSVGGFSYPSHSHLTIVFRSPNITVVSTYRKRFVVSIICKTCLMRTYHLQHV